MPEHLLLEYGNSCDLGQTRYRDGFLNRLYLPYVDLQYPDYKVSDQDEKDGNDKDINHYRMIEKIYSVKCLVPEYILDSITTLPLLDTVRFYALDGRIYDASNISIASEWTPDNGWADVTIRFTCESVIQDYCCHNMQVDCYDQHPTLLIAERGNNEFRLYPVDFPPNAWADIVVNNGTEYVQLGTFNTNAYTYIDYANPYFNKMYAYANVHNYSCSYDVLQTSHEYTDYVDNGNFETLGEVAFASWIEYTGNGTVTADHDNAYKNYYCCKLYRVNVGNNPSISQIISDMVLGQYRFSFWAKADAARMIMIQINRGTDSKEYMDGDSNWVLDNTYFTFSIDTDYTEYSIILETYAVQHEIYLGLAAASTIYIDNVKMLKIG